MEELVKCLHSKHKEIEDMSKELKILKNEYELLSDQVKDAMKAQKLEKIKLSSGVVLHLKEKKSFASINKEYILEQLKTLYKQPVVNHKQPDQLAEITTETLIENRDSKVNLVLKFLKR